MLDEGLKGGVPLDLARGLLTVNAMINVAVVSGLDAKAFHEASEELDILAAVPARPSGPDGAALAVVSSQYINIGNCIHSYLCV